MACALRSACDLVFVASMFFLACAARSDNFDICADDFDVCFDVLIWVLLRVGSVTA